MKRRMTGFTLIELMVTIAIIGILTSIALPQYRDYIIRTRLTEAVTALAPIQAAAENFWRRGNTFTQFDDRSTNPLSQMPKNTKNFDFTTLKDTPTELVVQAKGKDTVAGFTYTVNQNGDRATTVAPAAYGNSSATCWIIAKAGKCAE